MNGVHLYHVMRWQRVLRSKMGTLLEVNAPQKVRKTVMSQSGPLSTINTISLYKKVCHIHRTPYQPTENTTARQVPPSITK